jgi:hypothetical protein
LMVVLAAVCEATLSRGRRSKIVAVAQGIEDGGGFVDVGSGGR